VGFEPPRRHSATSPQTEEPLSAVMKPERRHSAGFGLSEYVDGFSDLVIASNSTI